MDNSLAISTNPLQGPCHAGCGPFSIKKYAMKAEGDACWLTPSRCQRNSQAANRKVSHVGSKNGSEVLFVEDNSLGNIPSFGLCVKTNALRDGTTKAVSEKPTLSQTRFERSGLVELCMSRGNHRNAALPEQLQTTVTILFKPDADHVSKREVELVMSVFDEVLLAMKRIESDAATAKSSSFNQKVEPGAVPAIKGGRVHSKQGA